MVIAMLCRQDLDANDERFHLAGTFQCGAIVENIDAISAFYKGTQHKRHSYFTTPFICFMRRNLTFSTLFHSSTYPLLKLPLQSSQPTSYSAPEFVHSAYASMPVPLTILKTSIQVVTKKQVIPKSSTIYLYIVCASIWNRAHKLF